MDKGPRIRGRRARMQVLTVVGALLVGLVPAAVMASDRFTDVPETNVFHDDIAWLADNGVTAGCNPPTNNRFCPSANVTRDQMAAFMKRLATNQVVDAGTLVGQTKEELTSDGFSVFHDGELSIADISPETLVQLDGLPPGSYVVIAKTTLFNPGVAVGVTTCQLVAGGDFDQVQATLEPISFFPVTLTVVHSDSADGTAELKCEDNGWDHTASWTKITAISVDGLTNNAG